MTRDAALLTLLADLQDALAAARVERDRIREAKDELVGALAPYLDGEPEVRAGVPVGQMVEAFLRRTLGTPEQYRAAAAQEGRDGQAAP